MTYRAAALSSLTAAVALVASLSAQPAQNANVPKIRFESIPDFLKYSPDMNLGEVLGVAINSKGALAVLNHPGSATAGPLYGNASTQILEDGGWEDDVARIERGLRAGLPPDARVLGAIGVIELDRPVNMARATRIVVDHGVWLRPFRNLIYCMPPYITSDEDLARITQAMVACA